MIDSKRCAQGGKHGFVYSFPAMSATQAQVPGTRIQTPGPASTRSWDAELPSPFGHGDIMTTADALDCCTECSLTIPGT